MFEESVYAQISENRNLIKSSDNVVSRQSALDNLSVLLNAQFENYPELKSAHLIRDLMSQSLTETKLLHHVEHTTVMRKV